MGMDKEELTYRISEVGASLEIVDSLIHEFNEDDGSTYNTHERHVYLSALADVKRELILRLVELGAL